VISLTLPRAKPSTSHAGHPPSGRAIPLAVVSVPPSRRFDSLSGCPCVTGGYRFPAGDRGFIPRTNVPLGGRIPSLLHMADTWPSHIQVTKPGAEAAGVHDLGGRRIVQFSPYRCRHDATTTTRHDPARRRGLTHKSRCYPLQHNGKETGTPAP
jgi:hypothetical protein